MEHKSLTYLTALQSELIHWFNSKSKSLGELYEGAVHLMNRNPPIPGHTRFIAHAVREIINRLPDAIAGSSGTGPLNYKNELDEIVKIWERTGLPLDDTLPREISPTSDDTELTIPVQKRLFLRIAKLVKKHIETREKPEDIARRLFIGLEPGNEEFIDQLRPVIIKWIEIGRWYVGRAHNSKKTDAELITGEFRNHFDTFENILASLIRKFFDTTDELNAILDETNKRSS